MRCVIARPQVTGASRLRKEPGTCQSLVWSRASVVAAPLSSWLGSQKSARMANEREEIFYLSVVISVTVPTAKTCKVPPESHLWFQQWREAPTSRILARTRYGIGAISIVHSLARLKHVPSSDGPPRQSQNVYD